MMPHDPASEDDLDRVARDWLVRVQLGDASGPGETAGARAEAIAAFEAWRGADPAHAAAYHRLQRTMQHTETLAGGRLVAESRLSQVPFSRRHPVLTGALAVSLAAAAGLTLYWVGGWAVAERLFSGSGLTTAPAGAVYVTLVGETRSIALPDGSTVLLDTDSELRVDYSNHERRLRLDRGRARFTVAHDPSRVFAVDAGNGIVIAHGTIFDVAVNARGVNVALLRGIIEVRRLSGRMTAPSYPVSRQLTPGEQLNFTPAGALPAPQPAPEGQFAWVSRRLLFRDARLADAVAEINRYNARKIALVGTAMGDLRVSGGYDAREPQAFVTAIAQLLDLRVEARLDGWLLVPSPGNKTEH